MTPEVAAPVVDPAFVADLEAALPPGAVVADRDLLASYRHDRTAWMEAGWPQAVVFPRSTEEVAAAVAVAGRHRTPIVARGAGSGLAGGSVAVEGCLVLCTERMDRVHETDVADQTIVVEPGVRTADVSAHVAEHGLWYPPDPASKAYCTIGGNVATNAGGLCCVKYGVTRDYVMGLEVVLADGSVIETGRRTVKGVAGLDLTGLFVGSEGMLGIVTRVRLRLRPLPPAASTLVTYFPTLAAAGGAVVALVQAGLGLSMVEIVDRRTLRAIEDWRPMGLDTDAAALLLVQTDDAAGVGDTRITRAGAICDTAGATFTAFTSDPDEGDALLEARRVAYTALERLGATLLDDVAVPRTRIPALLERIERIADDRGVTIGTFGHAGDGNMHPTIVVPHGDLDGRRRAGEAFADIVATALELGGTITGEHGVGALKRDFLAGEIGVRNHEVQRSIKRVLDPHGLLNPGKWL